MNHEEEQPTNLGIAHTSSEQLDSFDLIPLAQLDSGINDYLLKISGTINTLAEELHTLGYLDEIICMI